jgi:hypothetical protein
MEKAQKDLADARRKWKQENEREMKRIADELKLQRALARNNAEKRRCDEVALRDFRALQQRLANEPELVEPVIPPRPENRGPARVDLRDPEQMTLTFLENRFILPGLHVDAIFNPLALDEVDVVLREQVKGYLEERHAAGFIRFAKGEYVRTFAEEGRREMAQILSESRGWRQLPITVSSYFNFLSYSQELKLEKMMDNEVYCAMWHIASLTRTRCGPSPKLEDILTARLSAYFKPYADVNFTNVSAISSCFCWFVRTRAF